MSRGKDWPAAFLRVDTAPDIKAARIRVLVRILMGVPKAVAAAASGRSYPAPAADNCQTVIAAFLHRRRSGSAQRLSFVSSGSSW
jgi:hypothetical protein